MSPHQNYDHNDSGETISLGITTQMEFSICVVILMLVSNCSLPLLCNLMGWLRSRHLDLSQQEKVALMTVMMA